MIVKDTAPIEVELRPIVSRSAFVFAGAGVRLSRWSMCRTVFVRALVGVLALGALVGALALVRPSVAAAFQLPRASAPSREEVPVQIGVSEEDLLRVKRLEPASGTPVAPAVPNVVPAPPSASVPPTPLPLPGPEPSPRAPSSAALPSPSVPSPLPEVVVAPVPVVPPSGDQGASIGVGVAAPSGDDKDDIYYDSLPLPPTGSMAKSAGPRKVNPSLEPAQKFVIVKKTKDAGGLESLLVSANRALALGRYDAALDMFTRLYRKNPRDARILMGRAVSLQYAGRREAAIGAYDEILKLDPSSVEAKINRAGLVGVQYPAVALRDLLALRDQFPGHAGLAAQIGLMQARLGNDAEAMQYLGAAASLEPRSASHIYNMAVVADRMENRAKAISLYEQSLQLDGGDTQGVRVNRDAIYARLSVLREGKK